MSNDQPFLSHTPVLLDEVLQTLQPKDHEVYIDATFGGGGYTKAILEAANCKVIGIDRDADAVKRGLALKESYPNRFDIIHAPFSKIPEALASRGIQKVNGIVFDLGISSYQIDDASRGFSFRFDAPLAMTMGCNEITAFDVVNHFEEKEIADILYAGEERHSRRIAKKILEVRKQTPINTTLELANIVRSVLPKPKDFQNPATLTFQALRIFVNQELLELENALEFCKTIIEVHGRVVFVTFHSLEDRMVKQSFRRLSGGDPLPSRHIPVAVDRPLPYFTIPKRQPLTPSEHECEENSRARSGKLRYAIRTAHHHEGDVNA